MEKIPTKTIKNQFNKQLTFDNILLSHLKSKKNKSNRRELILFEFDLETNLYKIYKSLLNETYKPGKYRTFTIYEPKQRIIKSLPYKDRVVQTFYIDYFIKPYIIPRLIKDTYACIDKRGTLKAVLQTKKYMNKMKNKYGEYYIIKCDIKKYFYNINKNILYNILKKYIKDKKLLNLTKTIIFDEEDIVGIPIGNYTSQYFANIYLHILDKYIKETLHIKYYIRYMDDFIIFTKNKNESKIILNKIEKFIKINLKIELNKKTKYYPSKLGIDFCSYKIYETHLLLRKIFKQKTNKKLKIYKHLRNINKLDSKYITIRINYFIAHTKHANSYNYRLKYIDLLNNIISNINY